MVPPRVTTLRLYRILQRKCLELSGARQEQPFFLQTPWEPHREAPRQQPVLQSQEPENLLRVFCMRLRDPSLSDWMDLDVEQYYDEDDNDNDGQDAMWTTIHTLQAAIRQAFRQPTTLSTSVHHQWAIRAYQLLTEQQTLQRHCSISEEDGVRIVATSNFLSEGPGIQREENSFQFAYRLRIENIGKETIQLLGRTWNIEEEADTPPIRVYAPNTGVVGFLPVLQPGHFFEYRSGCEIGTASGTMGGCLHFARVSSDTVSCRVGDKPVDAHGDDGDRFEITVNKFPLLR
jgi:ApaG protein